MDDRLRAFESDLGEVRARLVRLETDNAALRRGRSLAIGLALLALASPALLFVGVLSPRFHRVTAKKVETPELRGRWIALSDGEATASLQATGDYAGLTLSASGGTVSASAGQDAFLRVASKGDQEIFLQAWQSPILGATLVVKSKDVRSGLRANRNGGEESRLTLDTAHGSTSAAAWAPTGTPFAGGFGVARAGTQGLHLGTSGSEAHLSLDAGGLTDRGGALSLRTDPWPSIMLRQRGAKGAAEASLGIVANQGGPSVFGIWGDKSVFHLKAP